MGDVTFRVVPGDMEADAAKWGSAADSLGGAHREVPALGVSFGGFQAVVGQEVLGRGPRRPEPHRGR